MITPEKKKNVPDHSLLMRMYDLLFTAFGPQHWWPGDTPFEVMVGAVLTQNTNWGNVELAIANLKAADALEPLTLHRIHSRRLASLIRPAGYYTVKTKRLKSFVSYFLSTYGGNVRRMRAADPGQLRTELLGVHGIGPETADSILLYALGKPFFVIDAYTKRVLSRHGIMDDSAPYDGFQGLFHASLSRDAGLFNEYHALFVSVGKNFCKPVPRCRDCPLLGF